MKPLANQAIAALTPLREQLGPEYLAYWVSPNVILTLSGARAYCDGVFWDDAKKSLLEEWYKEILKSEEVINQATKVLWSETGIKEPRPGEKYAGYDFVLEDGLRYVLQKTDLLNGMTVGEIKQQTTWEGILGVIIANLRSQARFKKHSKDNLEHIAFGVLVGYPDKAILGAVSQWEEDNNKLAEPLVDAKIYYADYYICPQPIYSYPKHLSGDPVINDHENLWSSILKDYYDSDFHKSLEADKLFQQKLREIGSTR